MGTFHRAVRCETEQRVESTPGLFCGKLNQASLQETTRMFNPPLQSVLLPSLVPHSRGARPPTDAPSMQKARARTILQNSVRGYNASAWKSQSTHTRKSHLKPM